MAKPEEMVNYDNSFSVLADMLGGGKKISVESLHLSTFEDYVQRIYSLSYPTYNFNVWHIHKICRFIDDVLKSETRQALVVLPRGHLKSTLLGYAFSTYRFLTAHNDGMYVSFKDSLAEFHMSNIKRDINNNPVLSNIMKDLRPKATSGIEYEIEGRTLRMYYSGIFSMKRGYHADTAVIVDDVLGTIDNPLNLSELEHAESMFNSEVFPMKNPGCPLIVFGTPIDYSDLLFKLMDNDKYSHLWLPAINPDEEHDVLWREVYSKEVLKATEDSIKWKAFSTEFLLTPVMALEAYITGEDMDKVTDEKLRAYGINSIFNKSRGMVVVGGVDVGKKRHPSHMSLFMNDNDGNLIQIFQEFWDNMDYSEQAMRIQKAVDTFGIDVMYIDSSRAEMEDRGLPSVCKHIRFNSSGSKNQVVYARDLGTRVENKKIRFLRDERQKGQITCVTNDFKAPETVAGHGEAFWSAALAVGAYEEYYGRTKDKQSVLLGNISESFSEKKPNALISMSNDICKICNKRTLIQMENKQVRCTNCMAVYTINDRMTSPFSPEKLLSGNSKFKGGF